MFPDIHPCSLALGWYPTLKDLETLFPLNPIVYPSRKPSRYARRISASWSKGVEMGSGQFVDLCVNRFAFDPAQPTPRISVASSATTQRKAQPCRADGVRMQSWRPTGIG